MWMLAAFAANRTTSPTGRIGDVTARISLSSYLLVAATAVLMGLRYQVGGDWFTYLENYEQVQLLSFSQTIGTFEAGYSTLVFLAGRMDIGMWFVNLCCAVIMTLGIARFCARQPNPALSFLVAIPYLIIVVGMGYTRQGTAIGLVLAGLADANGRSTWKLILYVLAATLFHKTAILVLPMALVPLFRRNFLYAIGATLAFVLLFSWSLSGSTDQLIRNYVDSDYESSGAAVRVAMNVPPAILALLLRKKLGFDDYQRDVWSMFAIVALATFPLVIFANFTTAIDRLALFLIPLQIAILPRIPYIAGNRNLNGQLVIGVCLYSAAIQLVWLVFATHSTYWVPYQAYLLNE